MHDEEEHSSSSSGMRTGHSGGAVPQLHVRPRATDLQCIPWCHLRGQPKPQAAK